MPYDADLGMWLFPHDDLTIENLPDGRSRRAAYTRQDISIVAGAMFLARGFEATVITEVARQARVGVQTVYYHYPTKGALLVGALDQAVGGLDRRIRHMPLENLAWARGARAESDLSQRLFLHVRGCADLLSAGAALTAMLRAQAGIDPTLTEVVAGEDARHRALHRALIDSLGGELSHLTTPDQATDVLGLVLGAESWNALVGRAGWSRLAWARWAHRTVIAELLGPATVVS